MMELSTIERKINVLMAMQDDMRERFIRNLSRLGSRA